MSLFPQQSQAGVEDLGTQSGANPSYVPLNPHSAAKQMAALTATSHLRRASQSGGTSDTTFGARQNPLDISTPDPMSITQPQRDPDGPTRSRRAEFYKHIANLMSTKQMPLPASITGIPSAYDHATSQWKSLEPTAEPGGFRLMGRDIDLFKLWQLVITYGGQAKISRDDGWITLLPHFGFTEETPESSANVARALRYYYIGLLGPFEEVFVKSMQQKALAQQRQSQQAGNAVASHNPAESGMIDSSPQTSQTPTSSRPQSITTLSLHSQPETVSSGVSDPEPTIAPQGLDNKGNQPSLSNNHNLQNAFPTLMDASQSSNETNSHPTHVDNGFAMASVGNANDEMDGKKRKLQEEDTGKRVRQRTESSESEQLNATSNPSQAASTDSFSEVAGQSHPPVSRPSTSHPSPSKQPRMRRKVEYLPLAREVETYGGRDLELIDVEMSKLASRRTQRSVDEWGTVDIDGLTMSIRSRLPIELSYAITVLGILSTMRGQAPDAGFSLQQCEDLLDELLELLREQAFDDADDKDEEEENEAFWMHRELVSTVRDNELQAFPGHSFVKHHVAMRAEPKPSATDVIFAILNIFRNFSSTTENQRFMSQHPDLLDLLLRISSIPLRKQTSLPIPASPVLSLPDIIKARRDVLTIVSNLVSYTNLASHPPRVRTRLFELLASFLVEPHDLCSPAGIVMQSGAISAASVRPPLLVDLALEAFSKLSQPDNNRLALSKSISASWLWSLFTSLVHRLPVSSEDFAITMRMHDVWLSYIEKVVLSIYSLCFLASPELKTRIKTDRTLGFTKLILRMVKRFVSITHPEARQYFLVSSRRAIEALKLIDEGGDAFESPQSTGPLLAFGMGFGESDVQQAETGVGLLAAFQDDVTWTIMLMNHVDDVMFAELDSLSRINV